MHRTECMECKAQEEKFVVKHKMDTLLNFPSTEDPQPPNQESKGHPETQDVPQMTKYQLGANEYLSTSSVHLPLAPSLQMDPADTNENENMTEGRNSADEAQAIYLWEETTTTVCQHTSQDGASPG